MSQKTYVPLVLRIHPLINGFLHDIQLTPSLREECANSGKCAQFTKHFEHCQEKVEAGEGFKGEDCVEEL